MPQQTCGVTERNCHVVNEGFALVLYRQVTCLPEISPQTRSKESHRNKWAHHMHQLNLINSLTKWAQTFDSKLKKILSADLAGDILKK